MFNGRSAHFLFVSRIDNLRSLLETTLPGLGYDLVDLELSGGGLVRVFIDKPGSITVDDCALVSNHLTRLFGAEGVSYERLEVSSPGLDRPLRKPKDFQRFEGERAHVKMRVPVAGRKNFTGVLRGVSDAEIRMEVDGAVVSLALSQVDKARLVPDL
jgi:ribosome maturation factor RimP